MVPDGMADHPMDEFGGRTPCEAANTPWMDKMAAAGMVGTARTVPEGMEPGSDVANLSILGYDPGAVYTGRAPFEAASMGVDLGENDIAYRLNLVTLDKNYTVMAEHSAGHITTEEAAELISTMGPITESMGITLYPGVSYRNLMVWRNGPNGMITVPPHDFAGEAVHPRLPSGPGAEVLLRIIIKSWKLFEHHPINRHRVSTGKLPANSVWPWGQGKRPRMQTLQERFGITGAVVAAVDLMKGIGRYAGLEALTIEGATGYLDTNYEGKVAATLNALEKGDLVFLHVEAPDEASHSGKPDLKIQAIEDFDARVAGPLLEGLSRFPHWRALLMPDHRTPLATRTHTAEPVPFILLDSEQWNPSMEGVHERFGERYAEKNGNLVDAPKLLEMLLNRG